MIRAYIPSSSRRGGGKAGGVVQPRRYVTLGTDGFGRSDTRAALRDFFEVSTAHIVHAALSALADEGSVPRSVVSKAMKQYGIASGVAPAWER